MVSYWKDGMTSHAIRDPLAWRSPNDKKKDFPILSYLYIGQIVKTVSRLLLHNFWTFPKKLPGSLLRINLVKTNLESSRIRLLMDNIW